MIHREAIEIVKELVFNDLSSINKSYKAYELNQASYLEKQDINDLINSDIITIKYLDMSIINKAILILTTLDMNLTYELISYMNWCHNENMKIDSVSSVHPDLENILGMFYSMVWGTDEEIKLDSEIEEEFMNSENEYYDLAYKHRDGNMDGGDIKRAKQLGYWEFL